MARIILFPVVFYLVCLMQQTLVLSDACDDAVTQLFKAVSDDSEMLRFTPEEDQKPPSVKNSMASDLLKRMRVMLVLTNSFLLQYEFIRNRPTLRFTGEVEIRRSAERDAALFTFNSKIYLVVSCPAVKCEKELSDIRSQIVRHKLPCLKDGGYTISLTEQKELIFNGPSTEMTLLHPSNFNVLKSIQNDPEFYPALTYYEVTKEFFTKP